MPSADTRASGAKPFDPQRLLSKKNLAYLRVHLYRLGAVLAAGLVLIGSSAYLASSQRSQHDSALRDRSQAVAKVHEIESERVEIQDFHPKYLDQKARGFVGEGDRLQWVETFDRARDTHRIPSIRYDIGRRKEYEVDPGLAIGAVKLRASEVRFQARLLHEEDLVRLLDAIRGRFVVIPKSCSVSRNREQLTSPLAARLIAECTLYWPTLAVPDKPASPS